MFLREIVVGNCIESIIYAFNRECYYLATNNQLPVFYEKMQMRVLGSSRQDYTWCRFLLMLALQGKVLSSGQRGTIKITEDKISLINEGTRIDYSFNTCYIFDPTGLSLENEIIETKDESYKVFDDFEISRLGSKHRSLPAKSSTDTLASQIHYYISDRVDGANYITDCLVESRLSKEQLNSFDYSDTMARFSIQRHLESIGVYGNFMKFYKNGNPKYRKPKIIHKSRTVQKRDNNRYLDSKKVKFKTKTLEDIFNEIGTQRA
tara:strand:+ start:57 stop:845 length:789 start_codon:yes stop_codon:yes gene_type:complete